MLDKLKNALSKTASKLSTGISEIFSSSSIGTDIAKPLEEILIKADIDAALSKKLVSKLKKPSSPEGLSISQIKLSLAENMIQQLESNNKNFELFKDKLNIIMLCGVNGNGKTTSIGKLANFYIKQNYKVGIASCDLFRAAATDQLKIWAEKAGAEFFSAGEKTKDPSSAAYSAVEQAQAKNLDILFIDTAGRLQNQQGLMQELEKISRVVGKLEPEAPHYTLLAIDATTGRNALAQAASFKEYASINGIISTKLDGSAKAGALINISNEFQLPIYFIGCGEKMDDIMEFNPRDFVYRLLDIEVTKNL